MVTRMSGLLAEKHIVVTGVLTDDSLAYAVADLAQREGAEVVLTGAGRGLSLTRRVARHLPIAARRAGARRHGPGAGGRGRR